MKRKMTAPRTAPVPPPPPPPSSSDDSDSSSSDDASASEEAAQAYGGGGGGELDRADSVAGRRAPALDRVRLHDGRPRASSTPRRAGGFRRSDARSRTGASLSSTAAPSSRARASSTGTRSTSASPPPPRRVRTPLFHPARSRRPPSARARALRVPPRPPLPRTRGFPSDTSGIRGGFSEAEARKLLEGVETHGAGRWAAIQKWGFGPEERARDAGIRARTQVDLKDKWRNMVAMTTRPEGFKFRARVRHRGVSSPRVRRGGERGGEDEGDGDEGERGTRAKAGDGEARVGRRDSGRRPGRCTFPAPVRARLRVHTRRRLRLAGGGAARASRGSGGSLR